MRYLSTLEKDDSQINHKNNLRVEIDEYRNGNYNLIDITTNEIVIQLQNNDSEEEEPKVSRDTYANIKPEDRIQELELIAFARTTGEEIGELLEDHDEEHGTKLEDEYNKLAYGSDE